MYSFISVHMLEMDLFQPCFLHHEDAPIHITLNPLHANLIHHFLTWLLVVDSAQLFLLWNSPHSLACRLVAKMILTLFVRWILSLPSSPHSLENPMVIQNMSLFPTPTVQLLVDPQNQWLTSRIKQKTTCALDDRPQSHTVTLGMLQVFPGTWKNSRGNSLRAGEATSIFFATSEPWQAKQTSPGDTVKAAEGDFSLFLAISHAAHYADLLSELLYLVRKTFHQCTPPAGKERTSCYLSLSERAQVSLQFQNWRDATLLSWDLRCAGGNAPVAAEDCALQHVSTTAEQHVLSSAGFLAPSVCTSAWTAASVMCNNSSPE